MDHADRTEDLNVTADGKQTLIESKSKLSQCKCIVEPCPIKSGMCSPKTGEFTLEFLSSKAKVYVLSFKNVYIIEIILRRSAEPKWLKVNISNRRKGEKKEEII